MKKEDKRKGDLLFIMGLGVGLLAGILLGIIFQQMAFTAAVVEIAEGLEGTIENIEIDFNETQIIEGYTEFIEEVIVPELKTYAEANK